MPAQTWATMQVAGAGPCRGYYQWLAAWDCGAVIFRQDLAAKSLDGVVVLCFDPVRGF